MSLKFKQVFITPEDESALTDAINADTHPAAYKWVAYVRDELFREWKGLPTGSHLKAAYENEVWMWNDEDLET